MPVKFARREFNCEWRDQEGFPAVVTFELRGEGEQDFKRDP